jgi:phosphatidylserine decarboxylase
MAGQAARTFEARYHESARVRSGYLPRDPSAVHEWNDMFIGAVRSEASPAPRRNSTVTGLATLLHNDPILRMLVTEMISQEPDLYPRIKRNHVKDVDELLVLLDMVIRTAPVFGTESIPRVAFPMSTLLGFMMMTTAGETVFRNAAFNAAVLAILSEWCKFLESEDSLGVVTRRTGSSTSRTTRSTRPSTAASDVGTTSFAASSRTSTRHGRWTARGTTP